MDVDVRKFADVIGKKLQSTPYEAERFLVFWLQWIKTHMMIPGVIERVFVIYDMKDVKVRDIPITKLEGLLKVLNELFKGGPYRNLFVN